MAKNQAYKTIRIYNSSFEKMNEYCDKYSLTKTEFIETILVFFDKTRIDPRDNLDVSAEVKKLKNQLISYIKTQEKNMLIPLIKKQDLLISEFSRIINEDMIDKQFLIEVSNELGNSIVEKLK